MGRYKYRVTSTLVKLTCISLLRATHEPLSRDLPGVVGRHSLIEAGLQGLFAAFRDLFWDDEDTSRGANEFRVLCKLPPKKRFSLFLTLRVVIWARTMVPYLKGLGSILGYIGYIGRGIQGVPFSGPMLRDHVMACRVHMYISLSAVLSYPKSPVPLK